MSPEEDRYAINYAKAEIREGYNTADPERILAQYADRFSDLSHTMPSFGGLDAKAVLRARLTALFAAHRVQCVWLSIDILLLGDTAVDHGWRELHLETTVQRTRYLQLWRKEASGAWRIVLFIDNRDIPSAFADQTINALHTTPPTTA
jgi:ketosteroid isomerase-like protein